MASQDVDEPFSTPRPIERTLHEHICHENQDLVGLTQILKQDSRKSSQPHPWSLSICGLDAPKDELDIDQPHLQTVMIGYNEVKLPTSEDSTSKVAQSTAPPSRKKRSTVSFLLPGEVAQQDEIAQIWPDLVSMHKRNYNVGITPPGGSNPTSESDEPREGSIFHEEEVEKHEKTAVPDGARGALLVTDKGAVQNERSKLPQRCPNSTGCHLLMADDDDCYCQKRVKAARIEARITNLIKGIPMDENDISLPRYGNPDIPVEVVAVVNGSARRASSSPGGFHKCETCTPLSCSSRSSAYAWSTGSSSFNPPTPHPRLYGELSENDIRVRIAQMHDELRILNLALARGSQKVSDSDESDARTPGSPEFHVGPDMFYLPSVPAAAKVHTLDSKALRPVEISADPLVDAEEGVPK